MIRHALGVFGVLAAGVLIAVSATMNWRFGLTLGRTELDGQIYGAASAAADCLKALVPFYFFAAIKNREWAQATATLLVGVVVTAYSLTSALGHAALNRYDTVGHRAVEAQSYQDLRGDLKRAQDQLSWIPQHRPAETVSNELESMKTQAPWKFTDGCKVLNDKSGQKFCQKYHALSAEMASGQQSQALEARVVEIQGKLSQADASHAMSATDPQAIVLAKIFGVTPEQVQSGMAIFIALLLEVGSGFGMFIACSQWRTTDRAAPSAPRMADVALDTAAVAVATPAVVAVKKPRVGVANDNKSLAPNKLLVPETDVQRFYKDNVDSQDGHTVSATALYEAYCVWCEERQKEPLALPTFGREVAEFGIQKVKKKDGVRYVGIALKSDLDIEEDKKQPAYRAEAA